MRKAYRRVGDAEDHAGRDAVRPERDRPAAIVIRHGLTGWSRAGRSEFDELDATEQAVAIDGDLEGYGWVTEQTGDAAMAGGGPWSTSHPRTVSADKVSPLEGLGVFAIVDDGGTCRLPSTCSCTTSEPQLTDRHAQIGGDVCDLSTPAVDVITRVLAAAPVLGDRSSVLADVPAAAFEERLRDAERRRARALWRVSRSTG